MRALTWHGRRDVRVDTVPDPVIHEPDDIVVKITSTGLCGSDLHLYEVLGPFLDPGDILGHEPMGIVAEVGPAATEIAVGDRVVVPFNVSCGTCAACSSGLHSQCETTQVREQGSGAALLYETAPPTDGHGMRTTPVETGRVERPLLGNGHGGCGRRLGETRRWKHRQGAPGRPHG